MGEISGLIKKISEIRPDFIGIAVKSPLFPLFADICRHIRNIHPNVKIIAGGPHATADPLSCRKYADYAVVGDGEYPLLDILNGNPGQMSKPFNDLDSLPFPQYGGQTYAFSPQEKPYKVSVYSTRGCQFACSYCQESVWRRKPARKSVRYFKEEIEYFRKLFPKAELFTISDSNFLYDMDWLEEFTKEFAGSGLRFWCAGNSALITDEMLGIVKKAGVQAVRIGVQSGSEYIRRDIFNRKDTLEQILEVSWMIKKHGIVGHYDFIIENPYDSSDTLRETRKFIHRLPQNSTINKFELRYWPKTPLTEKALNDGHITKKDVEGDFLRFGQWAYVYQTVYPMRTN